MQVEDYEPIAQQCARRYASDDAEREELAQLARIGIWLALENDASLPRAHAVTVGLDAIRASFRKQSARMRTPPGGTLLELQEPISDDGSLTLEDVVGKDDGPGQDELLAELHVQLRSRFCARYMMNIKQSGLRGIPQAIVRATIEQVAGLSPDDTNAYANSQFFIDHHLRPLLKIFFNDSYHDALSAAYPDTYVPWMGKQVPDGYWSGRGGKAHARKAMRWFCNAKGIKSTEDVRDVSIQDFVDEGLGGLIFHYRYNINRVMQLVFPESRPWRLKSVPAGFWDTLDNRRDALDDFLQHIGCGSIIGLTPEETYDRGLKKRVSGSALKDFHLSYLMLYQYRGRQYNLFHDHFPEQILPWTLANVRLANWPDAVEVGVNAMRWALEDYLVVTVEEVPQVLTTRLIRGLGLTGIFTNQVFGFDSSPFKVADTLYPGIFTPYDFRRKRPGIRVPDCGYLHMIQHES